jgi:hypothetical protein
MIEAITEDTSFGTIAKMLTRWNAGVHTQRLGGVWRVEVYAPPMPGLERFSGQEFEEHESLATALVQALRKFRDEIPRGAP